MTLQIGSAPPLIFGWAVGPTSCVVDNSRRCSSIHATIACMHPFDMIAFDGDGYSIPDLDVDVQAEVRIQWLRLNAVVLPTVKPRL